MSNIHVLGDLELNGALSFTKNLSEFPQNPAPRSIVVKEGIPYIYTELVNGSGFLSWQPIGIKQASYLHTQGVASTVWTVTHNFNTSDFAYFVYDSDHRLVVANIHLVDNNTCQIELTQAMTGTVVLFSLQYLNSTTLAASQQLDLGGAVLTTDAGTLKVSGNPVAFQAAVDSADAILSTRIDNLESNIDPVALDSLSELVTAFQAADGDLAAAISSMGTSAVSSLGDEVIRAQLAELSLQSSIDAEIARATGAEAVLATEIAGLMARPVVASYNDLTDKPSIPTVPSVVSAFTNDSDYQSGSQVNSAIGSAIAGKADASGLATVAVSGSYADLSNKPTIPTVPSAVSEFTNDSGYQTAAQVTSSIQAVVGAAPAALDTLKEIADKLASDESAVSALTTTVAGKVTSNGYVFPSTGTKITYDSKGLVTGSTALSASDIPSLDWDKITTGKPTTLAGYGITDGITSGGAVASADKLTTPRTISLSSDVTGSVSFDGSTDATIIANLKNSGAVAGSYGPTGSIGSGRVPRFTVNSKGIITSITHYFIDWDDLTGRPTTIAGFGITDAQPKDADLTSIAGLAGTSGILKKTAANTWALDTNVYQTASDVSAAIQAVVGAAPAALDTLAEIATQLASDESAVSVLTTTVAGKAATTYVDAQLALKADSSSLSTVATTGSYSDLSNKPTIPTVPSTVSAFTNDSGYLVSTDIAGKADKADTYTKAEVDALIATAIQAFAATLYV